MDSNKTKKQDNTIKTGNKNSGDKSNKQQKSGSYDKIQQRMDVSSEKMEQKHLKKSEEQLIQNVQIQQNNMSSTFQNNFKKSSSSKRIKVDDNWNNRNYKSQNALTTIDDKVVDKQEYDSRQKTKNTDSNN